jgi:hypothetical protein
MTTRSEAPIRGNPPARNDRRLQKLPGETSSEARRAAVIKLVETRGMPIRQAHLAAGVASSTHALWMHDESWAEELEQAAARFESMMLGAIVRDGLALRSWRAKLELLRAVAPRYARRLDLHVEAVPIERELEEKLSDEQRTERLRALVAEAQRRLDGSRTEPT